MVVASPKPISDDRIVHLPTPSIDMSLKKELVAELMLKACEEFGFFKLINHGVSKDVMLRIENEGKEFFALPIDEKKKAGPPNPLGYGCRNIGFNGDMGEIEYLLLHTSQSSISQRAKSICKNDPSKFSIVVNEYVGAVRQLACEILDMLGEELGLGDKWALSRFLRDSESDSLFRINHYPPYYNSGEERKNGDKDDVTGKDRVGFGEHSDPQILSILRSNDVAGFQIRSSGGDNSVWVPVAPDPSAFYVNVGDMLEALTNGRLVSVRHRAMANSHSSRLSMIYFGSPPLHARISPLPELITSSSPRRYQSFTWAEYKKTMYSLRLSHNRLDLFLMENDEESTDTITWI